MLAMSDLSLMVKRASSGACSAGDREPRHRAPPRGLHAPPHRLDLLGCFAMTETGHGSDVQSLETTATYDPDTQEFVIHSPPPPPEGLHRRRRQSARLAAVFAQLITGGEGHGVHCFAVPIRDDAGNDLPGVTTSDCLYKGGLPGVDNSRIMFDHVRIPRENLLNKYADVEPTAPTSRSKTRTGASSPCWAP